MSGRRGWMNPDATTNASAGNTDSKAAPQDSSLFDAWLEQDSKPLGGKPTGGVQQAIRNQDDWFFKRGMAALDQTKTWPQPFEMFDIELHFGLVADSPSAWGALTRQAVKAGVIKHAGYRTTQRPSANSREVRTYVHTANRWAA